MHDSSSLSLGPTPLCTRYRPLLALLRTGALAPREAAALNEHLASCPWCQRELAAYDALDAAARQHLSGAAVTPLTLEDIMHATETPPDANVPATPRASRTLRPAWRRPPHLSTIGPLAAVVALALFAGLIFAAHSSHSGVILSGTPVPSPHAPTQTANPAQTTWTLTRLVVDGREQQLVPGRAPTLHFGPHATQFYGTGGCNSYGGTDTFVGPATTSGTALLFSSLYFTQARCLPAALMDQESAYFRALQGVKRVRVDGNTLTLTSTDGSVQLTFRAN
jgi:heat shock protein HslJ